VQSYNLLVKKNKYFEEKVKKKLIKKKNLR